MDEKINILLLQPPGRLRDSLLVLLRASPVVGEVWLWDEGETAVSPLPTAADLLILDAHAPAAWSAWRQLQHSAVPPPCCALVRSSREEKTARRRGVDAILRAGYTAEALFTTLIRLAQRPHTGQK
jgi:hypothetical protein